MCVSVCVKTNKNSFENVMGRKRCLLLRARHKKERNERKALPTSRLGHKTLFAFIFGDFKAKTFLAIAADFTENGSGSGLLYFA